MDYNLDSFLSLKATVKQTVCFSESIIAEASGLKSAGTCIKGDMAT
jgi:hypothetical protein